MQIITEADFRRQIKNQIAPGYLFYGDEDYLKTHAAATLRGMICPDESLAVFNYYKITPLDYNPDTLLAAMSSPPMMGERKLIELCGFDLTKMRAEELATLFDVLSALPDYDYNTLVLSIPEGGIDEGRPPKKLSATFEKLSEYLIPVKFEKCSPQKLAMWAARHFEHNGVAASAAVCAKTVEFCGRDMYKLAGEIDKISFYVRSKGRTEVADGDVILVATPDIWVAILTFGINSGAYVAEIIRGGLESVDDGQLEAGSSLGLSKLQVLFLIVLPQAIRRALPPFCNEFIALIKETSIVGTIGVVDLTKVAAIITARTYEPFAPYIIIALLYLAVVLLLTYLLKLLERRLAKSDR